MKKILIFKTDRIGDFIYFSPCLKIIKDNLKNCKITLICSKYNYQIAKNYKFIDEYIIISKKLIKDFFILKKISKQNFDYLFQMDGNNNSYYLSMMFNSNIKTTIFFYKEFKFLNFKLKKYRPNNLIRKTFSNYEFCDENYENKDNTHYQKLYFRLMEKLDFKIIDKKNIFYLENDAINIFNNTFKKIPKRLYLMHIDEKINRVNKLQKENIIKFIKKIGKKNQVIISFGIWTIKYKNDFISEFGNINYDGKVIDFEADKISNIICISNLPLNLLAVLVNKSEINISMHSGSIVHISAALNKPIIDILEVEKNNEIDRWIPEISNYKRVELDKLNDFEI